MTVSLFRFLFLHTFHMHFTFLINATFMAFSRCRLQSQSFMCLTQAVNPKPLLCYFRYHWNTAYTVNFSLWDCGVVEYLQWHHMWTGLRHAALTNSADMQPAEMVFFMVLTGLPFSSISNLLCTRNRRLITDIWNWYTFAVQMKILLSKWRLKVYCLCSFWENILIKRDISSLTDFYNI